MNNLSIEIVSEASPGIMDAARILVRELHSVNQVPVTIEWLQSIADSDATRLLVARGEHREIVGMAVLVIYPTLVNPRALIETLVVAPEFRGRGVGQRLIQAALAEARRAQVNTVRISAHKDNAAANHLYVKLGAVLADEYAGYEFELSVGPQ